MPSAGRSPRRSERGTSRRPAGRRIAQTPRRALGLALDRTDGRETLGSVSASSGMVWAMIADSVPSIGNRRGLMLRCAWELGQGRDGLHESSVGNGFVGGAVRRIADRAAQTCGSPGVSGDLAVPRMVEAGRVRTYDRPTEGHKWAIAWRGRRDRKATT